MGEESKNPKLGSCKTCGKGVSRTAKVCPHCGEEKPVPDSGSGGSFLNLLVLVFIASAFYIATSDKPQPHHRSGSSSYSSSSDAVDDAYRICQAMDKTGLTTGCKVGVFKVDVTMDTNGAEARKICAGVADMMTGKTSNFSNGKWQLRILSPYSSDQAIAVCPLK